MEDNAAIVNREVLDSQIFSYCPPDYYDREYVEPNLTTPEFPVYLKPIRPRPETLETLRLYGFKDRADRYIQWTPGQLEIIDCILHRSGPEGLKRVQVIALTQYGKSLAVAAAVSIRASTFPEKWALVAGTDEKAKIIMEDVTMFSLHNPIIRQELEPLTPLDRLEMRKSAERLGYRNRGEVQVFSANATQVNEVSTSLMGFGAQNVVEDESALIGDALQSTVLRMVGGYMDNFIMKIGNPFNRNHFLKTWESGLYHRIFIGLERAKVEGRPSPELIEEQRGNALFDIFYECRFPPAEKMTPGGWMHLLSMEELKRAFVTDNLPVLGVKRLGNDVAGGGRNYSTAVLRGYNVMRLIYKEREPDTMIFAGEVVKMIKDNGVKKENVWIDMVGIGRGARDRLKQLGIGTGVNGGEEPTDPTRFFNKRAEMFWRMRDWIVSGGKVSKAEEWLQLVDVQYNTKRGVVQIMSKEEMLKNGIDSPDVADAGSYTFYTSDDDPVTEEERYNPEPEVVTIAEQDPYGRR